MKPRVVDMVVCPVCTGDLVLEAATVHAARPHAGDLMSPCGSCHSPDSADRRPDATSGNCSACYGVEVETGRLACANGHSFRVRSDIPRLHLTDDGESADARSIRESFSRQWEHYDYTEEDRTWGQTLDERRSDFLRMVDLRPDDLAGKLVLDAGCGNALLSKAMTEFGCEVLAADLSHSVDDAFAYFSSRGDAGLHFVQADLMNAPFRPGAFDIVFCAGVLIVTPDSRRTLREVARAVAPGGRIFVWLYWRESGAKYKFKTALRRIVAPAPLFVRRSVAAAFVPQAMLRQYVRRIVRPSDPGEQLKWRERFVVQHDFFTPRYRWEHTPDELREWYHELGFTDVKLTEQVAAGFGMVAVRPPQSDLPERAEPPSERVAG